jgi:NADH:ubiquinone oxidoreductase subunit 4 (subunit M)
MKRFWPTLKDLSRNEWLALAPLILLVVAMGVYPVLILDAVNNPAQRILDAINGAGGLTSLQLPW